jgi:hypothetical protein
MAREVTAGRIRAARIIAVAADLIQLMPALWGGGINPLDDVLDLAVALFLGWLVGFHWVFLPSFAMELIPVVDFAPTWTIAVLIATRNGPTEPADSTDARKPGRVIDVEADK